MTTATLNEIKIIMVIVVIGAILNLFIVYYYQQKITKINKDNKALEQLYQGLHQLSAINKQIYSQPNDRKHIALCYTAIDIINTLYPIAIEWKQTSIVDLLKGQLNTNYEYIKISQTTNDLDLQSSKILNNNEEV